MTPEVAARRTIEHPPTRVTLALVAGVHSKQPVANHSLRFGMDPRIKSEGDGQY